MRLNTPESERVTPVDVVNNITPAFGIAAQGRVATLAPAYGNVLATTFELIMLRVIEPETVRKICLYRPLGKSLSPAAQDFASFLTHELTEDCQPRIG